MSYTAALVTGLCTVVLLTVLPLTLLSDPRSSEVKATALADVGLLQNHLQSETLRLRTGMSGNYDNLMATLGELRLRTELLTVKASESDYPEDDLIAGKMAEYSQKLTRLAAHVEDFSTHNTSAVRAIRSLASRLEKVKPDSAPSSAAERACAEIEARCQQALTFQALWTTDQSLTNRNQRQSSALTHSLLVSDEMRMLEREVNIAIDDRLKADALIRSIQEICREGNLSQEVNNHIERIQLAEVQRGERAFLIQSVCFLLAIVICVLLCVFGWRQSATLREKMESGRKADELRRHLEQNLESARRLESIGQLAAGIAHEINTPTQYVGDNTRFLKDSFVEIAPLLTKASELAKAVRAGGESTQLASELSSAIDDADLKFLEEEIPRAIEQSLSGIGVVRKIVQSIKEFSHPSREGMTFLDLNRAIESTITVASNEWKYVAEIETEFDPELPEVACLPGEINQVVLNLIVNAAHAIADVVGDSGKSKGIITISTRHDGESVEIRISDTGAGIPEGVREKIFDPFFTTKEVGKGTGQGLSIAHTVIVSKHSGTLEFETEIGKGTTFVIRWPLNQEVSVVELMAA